MSRNDILLVVKKQTKYYVIHVCADLEKEEYEKMITPENQYTFSRATALILAHNKQKKLHTEYGVVETY